MNTHFQRDDIGIGALILLNSVLLYILLGGSFSLPSFEWLKKVFSEIPKKQTTYSIKDYPEALNLSGKDLPFKEYEDYFRTIAEEKGAVYAYEVLRVAPFPEGTDLHLMGHVVGEELYKQKGIDGIYDCTQEFRNACSHSIVVGVFFDKGEQGLSDIIDACRKAPGGKGAYTMCFHGLGHGVLAYLNYEFEDIISLCKKTDANEGRSEEYPECVGGGVMEMISGGDHDKKQWEIMREKYLLKEDPLHPCSAPFMDEKIRPICYIYLTPHLLQVAGANLRNPEEKYFEEAFSYCDAIPDTQKRERDACFGGFGKEFVVLVRSRDIRAVDKINTEEIKKALHWCSYGAPFEGAERSCVIYSLGSLFWGGENDPSASVSFCSAIESADLKKACFESLAQQTKLFFDGERRVGVCNMLPLEYQSVCKQE